MPIRIGIAGIAGRMGRLLAEEALAAGADAGRRHQPPGRRAAEAPAPILPDIAALFAASDVVIDFTHASTAAGACRGRGAPPASPSCSAPPACRPQQEAAVARPAERTAIVYAANFAPGVNLFLAHRRAHGRRPAARAVRRRDRRDAPPAEGGCALRHRGRARPRRGARAGTTLEAAGTESGRDGHTGARKTGTIGFAALRGGQVVGEHTLLFAAGSRTHRADPSQLRPPGLCDRRGARRALAAGPRPPGLYDMKHVLGMG